MKSKAKAQVLISEPCPIGNMSTVRPVGDLLVLKGSGEVETGIISGVYMLDSISIILSY